MSHIVKITCFLTRHEDIAAYRELRRRIFPTDRPASTTVIARSLVVPQCLIEVEAVAVLD